MYHIRLARTEEELQAVKKIAQRYTKQLGFLHIEKLRRTRVHVAYNDSNEIVGFAHYHTPTRGANVGYTVLYNIAVLPDNPNAARMLLYSVPHPLRLTVTVDNVRANKFYLKAGMLPMNYRQSRTGRLLRDYQRETLFIQVVGADRARKYPTVAYKGGVAYGSRHNYIMYEQPFMLDIDWQDYDWSDYMNIVHNNKPVMAMVADYLEPSQIDTMLQQIEDLRKADVLNIMVCPKFVGAIDDVPSDCIVALSVPARGDKYGGQEFHDWDKLKGRRVHLLGGTPHKQTEWLQKVQQHGGVVGTVDGNSHLSGANFGAIFLNGRWFNNRREWFFEGKDRCYETAALSCRIISRWFAKGKFNVR